MIAHLTASAIVFAVMVALALPAGGHYVAIATFWLVIIGSFSALYFLVWAAVAKLSGAFRVFQ